MKRWATLHGHEVVPTDDYMLWASKFDENRRVGDDTVDGVRVSTVFLGLDHGYHGTPLWFETMTFGGDYERDTERYTTWEQAEQGHAEVVRRLKAGLPPWDDGET